MSQKGKVRSELLTYIEGIKGWNHEDTNIRWYLGIGDNDGKTGKIINHLIILLIIFLVSFVVSKVFSLPSDTDIVENVGVKSVSTIKSKTYGNTVYNIRCNDGRLFELDIDNVSRLGVAQEVRVSDKGYSYIQILKSKSLLSSSKVILYLKNTEEVTK